MALPKWTPGPVKVKRKPPHGHSQRTLTEKMPRPHHGGQGASQPAPVPFGQRPLVPGSSITYADALRQAKNATNVRYGQQETGLGQQIGAAQQLGVDQSGWYQQYLDALKGYQTDTPNRAAQTNAAVQAESDSLRALDQGNLTQQQQSLQADAATRGATVDPRLAQDASNASLVRQALQGGLGALIAQQGLSAGNQASNLAQVVGPGQRLQAQAQNMRNTGALREQLTGLKGQEGSFAQQFIDSLRGDEAKNILAASIASGKDLSATLNRKETIRTHKANEKLRGESLNQQRQSAAGKVNQYGITDKAWHQMSRAERQKVIHDFKAKDGSSKTPKPTQGPGSITSGQENTIAKPIDNAASWARRLKGQGKSQSQIRQVLLTGLSAKSSDGKSTLTIPKFDTYAVNAAMDLAFLGGLSAANVKRLHKMGVHVNGRWKILKPSHATPVKGLSQQQSDTVKGIYGLQ